MRLPFSPDFPLLSADIEFMVDCEVEWDGGPHLVINDVLDASGKVSLLHNEDMEDIGYRKLLEDIGYRVADMAEDCPKLLAKAVEMDCFEEDAA
jgi:hypothetical protein